ncbi:cytochrome c maturation protein CcmE [Mycobacterium sp. SMC-17]|uniref:cytochrome c maturation protein CcmE domain-containing protein n=1 Tax=Mycobacterium sp. SMC-17 TaxID=3381628 RepID=UPI0038781EDB
MTRKQRRLTLIGCALVVLAIAAGLVLNALRDSIVFFSTPSMVAEKHLGPGKRFRLGGLPKDVADALKKQGHWKDDYGAKPDNKPGNTPSASAAPTQGAMR